MNRFLRAGIVGGGRGSFIGAIHRIAAEMDGRARVVAGAMSSDPAVARTSADAWFLERSYLSFEEMARKEGELASSSWPLPTICITRLPEPFWRRASMSCATSRWR